jgi:hypothetical protein
MARTELGFVHMFLYCNLFVTLSEEQHMLSAAAQHLPACVQSVSVEHCANDAMRRSLPHSRSNHTS